LIPMNLPRLTPDTVDVIFDTYKTDLRCDWSLRRSCAGRHGVKYQQNGSDRRI
jgi:hypothetical protein